MTVPNLRIKATKYGAQFEYQGDDGVWYPVTFVDENGNPMNEPAAFLWHEVMEDDPRNDPPPES